MVLSASFFSGITHLKVLDELQVLGFATKMLDGDAIPPV
jgi:hypothetical protein